MTTLTATAVGYTATLDTDTNRVSICDADGHWAGDGHWTGKQIEDCPADLGDEAYEALDEAIGEAVSDAEVEIFGKTVTNAAEALIALRGACSTSKDDDGITYVWAGYLSGQEPGDGTRECELLVAAGVLARDTDEDGEYHVYRVIENVE